MGRVIGMFRKEVRGWVDGDRARPDAINGIIPFGQYLVAPNSNNNTNDNANNNNDNENYNNNDDDENNGGASNTTANAGGGGGGEFPVTTSVERRVFPQIPVIYLYDARVHAILQTYEARPDDVSYLCVLLPVVVRVGLRWYCCGCCLYCLIRHHFP